MSATAVPRCEPITALDESDAFTSFERRVAAAVIAQAVKDYMHQRPTSRAAVYKWKAARTDAERFLQGPGLAAWCDVVGWNADWVRRKAGQGERAGGDS